MNLGAFTKGGQQRSIRTLTPSRGIEHTDAAEDAEFASVASSDALATEHAAAHKKGAFQASSPKETGPASGLAFFCARRIRESLRPGLKEQKNPRGRCRRKDR